jgi:hypothetical protein
VTHAVSLWDGIRVCGDEHNQRTGLNRLPSFTADVRCDWPYNHAPLVPTDDPIQRPVTPFDETLAPGGAPTQPAAALTYAAPPVVLSTRYEILDELGHGGMGIVYRARDRETGEMLALKVLRPEIAADAAMAERFKSELRLARQITHKNVCRIYDFNRIGSVACISMELVEGESLRHALERFGNLSVRASARIAAQICSAMHEAHQQGIVHRDMKPENVMLDSAGEAKVMDFGIAQSVKHQVSDGAIAGTPAYMSPEQVDGKPADARSDIYAIRMVLYEMLTGKVPFTSDTPSSVARKNADEPPRPPRELEPSIPAHLERVVLRCLEKDPGRRFQSVVELERALLEDSPAEAAEFNIPVPERLNRIGYADYALGVAGLVGLFAFLAIWPYAVPAGSQKLQVDAVSARREAQQWLGRLEHESRQTTVEPQYAERRYRMLVFSSTLNFPLMRNGLFSALNTIDFPVRWKVEYGTTSWMHGMEDSDGQIVLNREGKPIEYVRKNSVQEFLPKYQPPPVENRREIARMLAEQMCGAPLVGIPYTELAGGPWNASYAITWQRQHPVHPPEFLFPTTRVTLWAEKPMEVHCPASDSITSGMPDFRGMFSRTFGLILAFVAIGSLLVWFIMGRCYTSALLMRRAPMGVILGLAFGWVGGFEFGGSAPEWWMALAIALLTALLWTISIVALEHRMLRWRPEMLATWELAWRGRLLDPAVGGAVLRGAAGGLALVGAQAGIAILTNLASTQHTLGVSLFYIFALGVPDPSSAGWSLASSAPALYVIALVLLVGGAVGFCTVGYATMSAVKWLQRAEQHGGLAQRFDKYFAFFLGASSCVAILPLAVHIDFARTLAPGLGFLTVPLVLGAALVWLAIRYDILTAVVAAGTLTLLGVNYTVVSLLSDIGNSSNMALFGVWAAVVLAAGVVVFRAQVMEKLQQTRAELR